MLVITVHQVLLLKSFVRTATGLQQQLEHLVTNVQQDTTVGLVLAFLIKHFLAHKGCTVLRSRGDLEQTAQ
jgi:hypothetical protein